MLPALSEICDKLVSPDQYVKIDKIEIDAGTIQSDNFESILKEKVLKQFKDQVFTMVSRQDELLTALESKVLNNIKDEAVTRPKTLRNIELLIYYFVTGTLPWWQSTDGVNIKKAASESLKSGTDILRKQLEEVLELPQARSRVVNVFTLEQLLDLFGIKNKELIQFAKSVTSLKEKGILKEIDLRRLKKEICDALPEFFNPDLTSESKQVFLNKLISDTYEQHWISILDMVSSPEFEKKYSIEVQSIRNLIKHAKPTKHQSNKVGARSEKDTLTNFAKQDKLPQIVNKEPTIKNDDVFIEINNAGLILLWPYLEMFFNELGLLEDKNFKGIDEQSKAVQLLHYLSFGTSKAEEHEWVLNKILCGMQLSDYVETDFELSEREEAECNNLLKAVIRNWKALKSTSAQGFQQSFIQRNGIVKADNNGYIIEIEHTSIDILLNKLSWPISIIRLPWNKNLIHVRWEV